MTRRDTRVVHDDCDIKDGEKLDANGDGKPDVWIAKGCRAVDLNFDGKIDAYTYFDGSGQVRRREHDYDRDGHIEEISIYKAGVLTEQERSTTLADKLDTWHFYQNGKLARTERDSDGDGVVDQWWEYKNDQCPMIHSDVDGDGRPDPGATVDYCKVTGYVPPERSSAQAPKHTFERPGSLPTEVENKPEDGSTPAPENEGEKKK
ncbi:MAG: hypothetical protein KC776_10185 [Myxococcales bacterium]|nr:hypothetical protein [Myxococcales bacterium]MCB9577727.1 hypothetical protein [Polyangiaceae bacterium]